MEPPEDSALPVQAAMTTVIPCAVDAFTSKVSSVTGDSRSGFNMSAIV
jgi:hypothetical protein